MNDRESRKPVDTPAEWFRFAKENFDVATREMAYSTPAFHTVCFLCHSAAEKYLKGYLIAQGGWSLNKTHDVVALLGWCTDYEPEFANLLEDGAILNEYIIMGRYPSELTHEPIDKSEAEEAVNIVRRIKNMVEKHIHPDSLGRPAPKE